MGLFSWGGDLPQDFHKLSTRVSELEEEIRTLKSKLKLSLTEWDDLYDKITRQVERMRKRANVPVPEPQVSNEDHRDPPGFDAVPGFTRHGLLAEAKRRGQA